MAEFCSSAAAGACWPRWQPMPLASGSTARRARPCSIPADGSIFVIVFLRCFGVPYADYKASAQPVSWLLMPATVSLAIPLYEKWELLEKNLAAIFASIAAGVLTSLGSVLAMAWVLRLERSHA
mgnify:CR=1 FL=1